MLSKEDIAAAIGCISFLKSDKCRVETRKRSAEIMQRLLDICIEQSALIKTIQRKLCEAIDEHGN